MKKPVVIAFALFFWAFPTFAGDAGALYQFSTIQALMEGVYDGAAPVGGLKARGDMGLGTFDALDGEMVVLDGKVFQVKSDGSVRVVPDELTTPFATVAFAQPTIVKDLGPVASLAELEKAIDALLPTTNLFYAVQVHGRFAALKTRSVPAQKKPFPKLTEVVKTQAVFPFRDIAGTLVGFRSPGFSGGLTVPGYHLHFLDKERTRGGHLLDCTFAAARLEITVLPRWNVELPERGAFAGSDLTRTREEDVRKVEK
ncbi:MAG: acetolactate decarboxylase [Sulfuricella sp.]|nr:acetolactate decarboxylase [Sulfuricella sp.]